MEPQVKLIVRHAEFSGEAGGMRWVRIQPMQPPILTGDVTDPKADLRAAAEQLGESVKREFPGVSFVISHRLLAKRAPRGYRALPGTLFSFDAATAA